ncbi:CAF17-like 4Fe-4S cluster assembly/insertion protein YgfZ [Rhizobium sp. SL86]|uniref:CAF17-like 4Fe-4S cluster assembly/insertion protein YgfZ n=1 Tax=Rhizobium sp. SL86 TaxID=2995148 RepID=UPI00227605EC|nr:folate-binding protein YgfZ [Rhizobium sp. SL86]MCY1664081.1 folate-binding protein YgfZ [Rhizobium sp. SL86]
MPSAHLPDRSLIDIGGADAGDFLHGIITTDVEGLPDNEARPGALLTPQGKILFDFLIWRTADGFVIECDTSQREALIRRLTMYKLRAAVTLSAGETGVTLTWGEAADSTSGIVDGAFRKAGILLKRQPVHAAEGHDGEAYDALRVEAGLAVSGRDYALQDAFPHDVLLDLDGGLSFRKGCYIGQEVVSRMQHRGTARRRVAQVTAEAPLPASGTELLAGGKPVGSLGTVSGNRALAIVRIDRVGDAMAHGIPVLAGDMAVSLVLPAWTGLSFPSETSEAET